LLRRRKKKENAWGDQRKRKERLPVSFVQMVREAPSGSCLWGKSILPGSSLEPRHRKEKRVVAEDQGVITELPMSRAAAVSRVGSMGIGVLPGQLLAGGGGWGGWVGQDDVVRGTLLLLLFGWSLQKLSGQGGLTRRQGKKDL